MLDKMYDMNLNYFKELTMYILAGKERLASFRENEDVYKRQTLALQAARR